MKTLKRTVALLISAVIVLALATTAFAAGETSNTITVNNAAKGESYSIYKMLDLSVDDAFTAYRYTVATDWESFFGSGGAGAAYVVIDSQGYVTWNPEKATDNDKAEFGKAAAAFAKSNSISVKETKTAGEADTQIIFEGLASGYYLVTSTKGTKVIVQTTPDSPAPVINEKNAEPTVDKLVKEDSNNEYGKTNTAQIGDTVEFKTTVSAKVGAKNYVLHDKMCDALTLDQNSFVIKMGGDTLEKDTDYTVSFENEDGCTFEIAFTESFLNEITADSDIVVTYSAVLNGNADIYSDTNKNDTWLKYGESSETEKSTTETATFKFELVKTKSDNKFLNGAEFELYDAKQGGTKLNLVKESDGSYRIATAAEAAVSGFNSAVITAGTVVVKGLDADTSYWLDEVTAPTGYNKLNERVEVKIEDDNLIAEKTEDSWLSGGVHVVNNTGSELPSTGGIGTTVFYAVGALLVVGAVILLIAKKRMSKYE